MLVFPLRHWSRWDEHLRAAPGRAVFSQPARFHHRQSWFMILDADAREDELF